MNTTAASENRAVAEAQEHENLPAMRSPGSTALILNAAHMQNMMAIAEVMAKGISTVPRHLQKNVGDCLAVTMQAAQWGMNPFAVAQKTHVVSGTLGYEAQLVNAVVTAMAPTKDRLNYEWYGDWSKIIGKFEERESKKKLDEDSGKPIKYRVPAWNLKDEAELGVKVWATMKGEDEPRLLDLKMTQARVRNSPLWVDDPRQQLAYLAVKRWTRLHCPDVLLGVYTPDELDERPSRQMGAVDEVTSTTRPVIPEKLLADVRAAADMGRDAFVKWWAEALPPERALLADEVNDLKARTTAADAKRTVENQAAAAATAPASAITETAAATVKEDQVEDARPAASAAVAATPAASTEPAVTWAQVSDALIKAKKPEMLDLAADLIKDVADATQRAELTVQYEKLSKGMQL